VSRAQFLFHAELNDLLPRWRRNKPIEMPFEGTPSVKNQAEALGVPHTEIGALLNGGLRIGFDYLLRDGDRIEAFPFAPGLAWQDGEPRFVLDNHLGRLAAYLRMLGVDVLYHNDSDDAELAQIAESQGRILLTRDRRLLMRNAVTHGYCVRSLEPDEQVGEVLRRYDLASFLKPFRRCLRCNGDLQPVEKEAVLERLQPLTRRYFDDFAQCPACGQVYWKGSHYLHMAKLVEKFQKE
jgi:hypothetical protein